MKTNKIERCLSIYERLLLCEKISVKEEAERFHVNERSILRDLEDIRDYLQEMQISDGRIRRIVFSHKDKKYKLETSSNITLSKNEVYSVSKILLESRAFTKKRLESIINKLLRNHVSLDISGQIKSMLTNEMFHYTELQHGKDVVDILGLLTDAVREKRCLKVEYYKMQTDETVKRKICPVAIMFSEYYFYLIAFFENNNNYPVIYRIDRLINIEVLQEKFRIPYKDRFEEGEFRKRIQFMQGGKLQRVMFTYTGKYLEAVMDRLPTAQIVWRDGNEYRICAEVYGTGIEMWLRSQGEMVKDIVFK